MRQRQTCQSRPTRLLIQRLKHKHNDFRLYWSFYFFYFFIYSLIAYLLSPPEYQPCTCYLFINRIPPSAPYWMINFNKINNKKKKTRISERCSSSDISSNNNNYNTHTFPASTSFTSRCKCIGAVIRRRYQSGETLRGQFSNYNAANVLFPPRVGITFISPIRMHILFGYSNDQTHIKSDCAEGIDRSPDSCTPRLWFNLCLH